MAKYNKDGYEVEVVEKLKSGRYLICRVFSGTADGWDDECEYFGEELSVVDEVFSSPPTEKLDQTVKELREQIKDLQYDKQGIIQEFQDAKKAGEEKLAKYKKYDQLKNLDMFLDGKITHYVIEKAWSGIEIISFEDTKCNDQYDQRDKYKLLTLWGRTDGNLEWRLSEYSDESGARYAVMPCVSYNEALILVQGFIDSKMGKTPELRVIAIAKKYGLKIDPEYVRKCEEKKQAQKDKEIKELEEKLKKLKENE